MKRIKLGHTDLSVSELCLGAMYFGWKEPPAQSIDRLEQYTEAGGNFIDTANMYAEHHKNDKDYYGKDFSQFVDGGSERLIGQWMKDRQNRHSVVVATKLGCRYPGTDYGTSPFQIRTECERSLKRLQTDYIDLLYLHIDDRTVPLEESLGALTDLMKEGKVRYIGASNFTAWRLAKAQEVSARYGLARFCCIQQRYSYLRSMPGNHFGGQREATAELLDYVQESGTTLIDYSPLLNGFYNNPAKGLLPPYRGPDTDTRLQTLREVAAEAGATPAQVVYYWLRHASPASLPLVASSTRAQFEEALASLELPITPQQLLRLSEAKFHA